MYAIVQTGGKQYKVEKEQIIFVEKLDANVGDKIQLDVVLTSNDGKIKTGKEVKDIKVEAEVLGNVKGEKIIVFHYKAKKNIRKKQGHRQPYTKLKVLSVPA